MCIDVLKGYVHNCSGRELERNLPNFWIMSKAKRRMRSDPQVCMYSGPENNGLGNKHGKL